MFVFCIITSPLILDLKKFFIILLITILPGLYELDDVVAYYIYIAFHNWREAEEPNVNQKYHSN